MEIKLWENKIPNDNPQWSTPNTMTFYPVTSYYPLPAVVVFPGGAYTHRADHEGEAIARYYNEMGFHAFVVDYRVYPHQFPCALQDAQRAIKLIKSRAKEYKVDVNMLFAIGFSAGGHLVGSLATMEDYSKIGDELDDISPKPTGVILGYPLISSEFLGNTNAHKCIERICETTQVAANDLSLEKCVNAETVPCFIWHTAEDKTVSVIHSLRFCEALSLHKIPFEYHVYPKGAHGLGLAKVHPDVAQWAKNSVRWMLSFNKN